MNAADNGKRPGVNEAQTMPARTAAGRISNTRSVGSPNGAPTLPDLLVEGLDVVFVGINPAVYSAERGHYFARPTNRFWPCLSRSTLSRTAREALRAERLRPENDRAMLAYGIGFTDLVKRATPRAGDLTSAELRAGVDALREKLAYYRPRIACFHGVTGYRYVHRILRPSNSGIELGPQDISIGTSRVYVVPNPSGANAHFTPAEQTLWYDKLAIFAGKSRI